MRYLFILFVALACSTAPEKEVVKSVRGGTGPVSFGKINQALIYLRSFAEKSDIVEKAGYVVLAHSASTFYGYVWDENKGEEEEFLRGICRKLSFKTDTTWNCALSLSRDILSQSTSLLNDFCKIQRIKKQCGEMQKEFIEILEMRLEDPLKPIQCALNEGKRIMFKGKPDFNRIPEGFIAVLSQGKVSTGSFDAIGMDSFHVTDLLTRSASFKEDSYLTVIMSNKEKMLNFKDIIRLSVKSGLRKFVLWGENKNGIGQGKILSLNNVKFSESCRETDKFCDTPAGRGIILSKYETVQDFFAEMEKANVLLILVKEDKESSAAVPHFEKSIIEPEDLMKANPTIIK